MEQRIIAAQGVCTITRPGIIAGVSDHPGANGIESDVAIAGQQIVFLLDGIGLVATVPQGARSLVTPIDVGHETPTERLQRRADRPHLGRRRQQVDVFGHQHIGMDLEPVRRSGLGQPVQAHRIVVVAEQHRLTIVPPLRHMHGYTGDKETRLAGHGWAP